MTVIMQHNQTIDVIWDIPSFTVKDDIPDWKVQTNEWNVEDSGSQLENRRHR